MKVELEIKPFLKAINEFRTASRKKTGWVLKSVAKLVVRDAMSLTPPNSAKSVRAKEGKVAWAVHKKMGENAIIKDLLGKKTDAGHHGGVFRVRKAATFNRAMKVEKELGRDMAGMGHAFWATKDGRVFGVEKNLYQPKASVSMMKKHHNKYRNKRGRVSRAGREDIQIGRHVFIDKMFVQSGSFNAYMKYLKGRIGKGKAGWNAASNALKVPYVPKWIKNHGPSGGSVKIAINKPIFPTIKIVNAIQHIQAHGAKNRVVAKALKSQTHNLKLRTEKAIKEAARKAKLKG
jgi:hypothetical protein